MIEIVSSHRPHHRHIDRRTLNSGHVIEGAGFILHQAKRRHNDTCLIEPAQTAKGNLNKGPFHVPDRSGTA